MNIINGGVTAAKGFKAYGLRAGIKSGKTNRDMAMIFCESDAVLAGTFTKNLVKAAPVKWDKRLCDEQKTARAVVINSGIANACTGAKGLSDTEKTAEIAAEALGVKKEEVLVASTGVIGANLPMNIIENGIIMLKDKLEATENGANLAAEAIMTTDTKPKQIAVEFDIGGKTVRMGGMCKGSGMIHPNMGTMLGFITTDCAISKELAVKALRASIEDSFNMVSVDGDTSTNDTVLLLADGMAENDEIVGESEDYKAFCEALDYVTKFLAMRIAEDGEGASRLFEVTVLGAKDKSAAKTLAKSVVTSSLTKAAVFGKDANWGRIMCALGYSGADFDPDKTDIYIESENGKLKLVENGFATDYSEEKATEILGADKVTCTCDVKDGGFSATAWGCDLTFDYVTINADYRS